MQNFYESKRVKSAIQNGKNDNKSEHDYNDYFQNIWKISFGCNLGSGMIDFCPQENDYQIIDEINERRDDVEERIDLIR